MTTPQAPLSTRRKFRPFYLALLLPVLLYMALAAGWRWAGLYGLTGDEPRYLLIADSIVRDGDLAIGGDDFAGSAIGADLGVRLEDQRRLHLAPSGYSVHGVALPLLLALPYRLGGILAVRLALAALSGLLLPLLLYQLARTQVAGERWAVALAVTMALGLPFLVAANQVYPDLPAGLLILFVVSLLLAAPQPPAQRRWIYIGLATALLPWLHLRFALPAGLLAVAAIWQWRRSRASSSGLAGLAWLLALPALSLAGLALFYLRAFGSVLGPYTAGDLAWNVNTVWMILAGLHVDSQQGIFLLHPLLLLGLAGLAPLARRQPGVLLGLALLYYSVVLPNAAHINWYGGESMWGRFHWAVAGLWVLPLAALVARLVKSPAGRRLAGGALAASLLLQLLLATVWVGDHAGLYNTLFHPLWSTVDLYHGFLRQFAAGAPYRLPSFSDPATYGGHLPNASAGLVVGLLIVAGIALALPNRRRRRWALAGIMAGIGLVVAATVLSTPPTALTPIRFTGAELKGAGSEVDGTVRFAAAGVEGYVLFGPHLRLRPENRYQVTLDYATAAASLRWEAVADIRTILASGSLPPTAAGGGLFQTTFALPLAQAAPLGASFEFRVWSDGSAPVTIRSLELAPLAD